MKGFLSHDQRLDHVKTQGGCVNEQILKHDWARLLTVMT
jgi:hypothetical protein